MATNRTLVSNDLIEEILAEWHKGHKIESGLRRLAEFPASMFEEISSRLREELIGVACQDGHEKLATLVASTRSTPGLKPDETKDLLDFYKRNRIPESLVDDELMAIRTWTPRLTVEEAVAMAPGRDHDQRFFMEGENPWPYFYSYPKNLTEMAQLIGTSVEKLADYAASHAPDKLDTATVIETGLTSEKVREEYIAQFITKGWYSGAKQAAKGRPGKSGLSSDEINRLHTAATANADAFSIRAIDEDTSGEVTADWLLAWQSSKDGKRRLMIAHVATGEGAKRIWEDAMMETLLKGDLHEAEKFAKKLGYDTVPQDAIESAFAHMVQHGPEDHADIKIRRVLNRPIIDAEREALISHKIADGHVSHVIELAKLRAMPQLMLDEIHDLIKVLLSGDKIERFERKHIDRLSKMRLDDTLTQNEFEYGVREAIRRADPERFKTVYQIASTDTAKRRFELRHLERLYWRCIASGNLAHLVQVAEWRWGDDADIRISNREFRMLARCIRRRASREALCNTIEAMENWRILRPFPRHIRYEIVSAIVERACGLNESDRRVVLNEIPRKWLSTSDWNHLALLDR